MMARSLVFALTLGALLFASSSVRADEDDDERAGDGEIGTSGRKPTVSGFPPPPPPPAGKGIPTPVHEDPVRIRGGASAHFGAYTNRSFTLGLIGIDGRIGAQFMDMFGLYAMPRVSFGLGDRELVRLGVALVPELTVEDLFFIGAGPEVYAPLGDLSAPAVPVAIRARTGFAFRSKRPGRRHAFSLAFDFSADFREDRVAFAPALSLGYDAF